MAKKKQDSSELNLDSLMDAVTNVVGVLMIVFVMMAINTAKMVQKILTDLPPVTEEQHQQMVQQIKELPPPPADPEKIEEQKKKAQQDLKKVVEELKTIDTSEMAAQMKFMDLDTFRKQLEEAKKTREKEKGEVDKLITEIERLKALLDETPVYQPPPPTYVRLPNPRPYPEKPNETRILVARQGVVHFNQDAFLKPILDGLDKARNQLIYRDAKIEPFADMLGKIYGTPAAAQQAWAEIAPFVGTFQMENVAKAHKALAAADMPATRQVLTALGDISIVVRSNMDAVAEAMVAAATGDLTKWTALDPSRDPTKPTIQAVAGEGRITFTWGSQAVDVKNNTRDIQSYFIKDLAGLDSIKGKSKDKVIYDAFAIRSMLERAATNPTFSGPFTLVPAIRPGATLVQMQLTPKAGAGETLDQMRNEGSSYQRMLRALKADPNGVALFQVMNNAFDTYLEARKIADETGVPASWEFLAGLDLTLNVTGYEVQRFALVPGAARGKGDPGIRIGAPKRTLD
ncbi:MAG TPA: hypothetical protein DIT13_04235 [Verrucomicrobiales bacterium]|nr:hypothetical protein [Verrucomicrobiales bacterium]HRJ07873.1 hypothetical protein [Prosthecobacter sp.]HRK16951.1 hypothetical protein [Prosthecobacter sp.]